MSAVGVSLWRALSRQQDDPGLGPLGRDRRSARIEVHAETVLHLDEATADITIQELKYERSGMGLALGYGTIQRFLIRQGMTREKRLGLLQNSIAPMS